MAKLFDALIDEQIAFIEKQKIFFTGTNSPAKGINVSPKGITPLRVLDSRTVSYLDFHGSGNRTAEDILSGSPVTIMFCSFDDDPLILRLFCRGELLLPGTPQFDELAVHWDAGLREKARNLFVFHVEKVQSSCGWGVPLFSYIGEKKVSKRLTGR